MTRRRPILLIHGGAGRRAMTDAQTDCLEAALAEGHRLLMDGRPALSVVEEAIRRLEESGLFNAGRGPNRQLDGVCRMDAPIMEGHDLRAGAVASIEGIVHPVTAARLVMERTAHVLLVGQSASRFARYFELERVPRAKTSAGPPPRQLRPRAGVSRTLRLHQALVKTGRLRTRSLGKETVGAVALDLSGTVAAGASTGGVDVMLPGRVGDTPLIGAGEAHPIIGEGMSMALQSAWMICTLPLAAERRDAAWQSGVARRYASQWRRQFAPRMRLAAAFAHLAMNPITAAPLMALTRHWPGLLTLGARRGGKLSSAARITDFPLTSGASP